MRDEQPSQRQPMGLIAALGVALGTTIGAGVFALTGQAAAQAGPLLPWAYALGVLPILFALAPAATLAGTLPTAGGSYKYPSRLLSPAVGFLAVWIFALGSFGGAFPLYALSCVDYLHTYFPSLPPKPTALGILTLFFLLNLRGVKLAAVVEASLVGVLIVALLVYAGVGAGSVDPQHLRIAGDSPTGLLPAAALLSFAYLGGNALIELGHEIRRPARTIPLAMLLCVILTLILYVGVGLVTVGTAGWSRAANRDLAQVASMFLSDGLHEFFVIGGALTALSTTLNAYFIWGTKSVQVLCADGFFPSAWSQNHPRWGTPHLILSGIYALSAIGVLLPLQRTMLGALASIGGLAVLFPVVLTAMVLRRRCPKAYANSRFRLPGPLITIVPLVGLLVCLGAAVTIVVDLLDRDAVILLCVWLAIGAGWLMRARHTIHLQAEPGWE